jgi:hypothetical protein
VIANVLLTTETLGQTPNDVESDIRDNLKPFSSPILPQNMRRS